MASNETSDSFPDEPLRRIEPDAEYEDTEVRLSGGVSESIAGVDPIQEVDEIGSAEFGTLEDDTAEIPVTSKGHSFQSYVAIDLDQIRAEIDAVAADDRKTEHPLGEPPDDSEVVERQVARAEAGNLIGHIGIFTHRPGSEPLPVENDDSTIATSMATAGDRLGDVGLTPETIIGRKAHTERTIPDLGLRVHVEGEILNEEVLPLAEALDAAVGKEQTPIARLNVIIKPQGNDEVELDDTKRSVEHPSTHATVWVRSGLRSDAYLDSFAMDREAGGRVEEFLGRLGFHDARVLTPEEGEYDDVYYSNSEAGVLLQVNRFMRELLK